jgi:hypothetical protein
MSGTVDVYGSLENWDAHLRRELDDVARAYTFDMDDSIEGPHLEAFPQLRESIRFLNEDVLPAYQSADRAAIDHQRTHRWLAKTAILSGGFAIAFAILQLALRQSFPSWTWLVAALEGVAVFAGLTAVVVGLIAKFDKQWLLKRHIAERLRMLKFQALGRAELWAQDQEAWRAWVRTERAAICAIDDITQVKEWSKSGVAEVVEPPAPSRADNEALNSAIALYYCRKRVGFQVAYFERQSQKLNESTWLHRAGLPLFFASVVAVVLHFGADMLATRAGDTATAHLWELIGIWTLALAALLPTVSFGVRAWVGAFELARSAHLFDAKAHALAKSSTDLYTDRARCASTMHHIAHVEHFLEHEHREWLRLLMEAEWFL